MHARSACTAVDGRLTDSNRLTCPCLTGLSWLGAWASGYLDREPGHSLGLTGAVSDGAVAPRRSMGSDKPYARSPRSRTERGNTHIDASLGACLTCGGGAESSPEPQGSAGEELCRRATSHRGWMRGLGRSGVRTVADVCTKQRVTPESQHFRFPCANEQSELGLL